MIDFGELPSKRYAIKGYDEQKRLVFYAARAIAKKPYRCPGCHELMDIGTEHTLIRYIDGAWQGRNHHHFHWDCAHSSLIDRASDLKRINSEQAAQSILSRKNYRRRANMRRRY